MKAYNVVVKRDNCSAHDENHWFKNKEKALKAAAQFGIDVNDIWAFYEADTEAQAFDMMMVNNINTLNAWADDEF